MDPRLISLCAGLCLGLCLLAAPAVAGGPAAPDPRLGPRLRLQTRMAPAPSEPLQLLTVWRRPPAGASCVGPVCRQRLRPARLAALQRSPDLLWVERPGRYRLRLDEAGPLVGAPAVRDRLGVTGRGVLLALIDTGLDWSHPDFIDAAGRTRVAWLLDQSLPATGRYPELESIGGGAVFAAADLQQVLDSGSGPALGAGRDRIGHGTLVAGIAAGDDAVYTGMAPGARLIAIKALAAGRLDFGQQQVLAGLAFARRVAEQAGRPLVINLSLGSQLGAHDGSEPVELALQALAEAEQPPCAVVVAAGNEGQLAIHARGAVRDGEPPLVLPIVLPGLSEPPAGVVMRVAVDVWYSGQGRLDARLRAPSGWRSEVIGPGSGSWQTVSWSPDGRVGLAASPQPHPLNGDHQIALTLEGEVGLPLSGGRWELELRGSADRVDAWIGEWDLGGAAPPRFGDHLEPDEMVGPPATARSTIAVGSLVGRLGWPGADGREHRLGGVATGQASPFSVRGPTRDGRLKPELLAPGQLVAASLSAATDPRDPVSMFYSGGSLRRVLPGGRHAVGSGTSMAAPFAAGLCALALEREPTLRGSQLQARLRSSARSDVQSGQALFSPRWGFGKLAARALLPAAGANGGPAAGDQFLCGAAKSWLPLDPAQRIWIAAVPRDEAGLALGSGLPVRIEAPGARFAGPVVDCGAGLYLRALRGAGRRGQRLQPRCSLGGVTAGARPSVVLGGSRQETTGSGVVGGAGGCATAPAASAAPWGLWLLGLFALRRPGRNPQPRAPVNRSTPSSSMPNSRCRPSRQRWR
jgi:subtilisin family serine protease